MVESFGEPLVDLVPLRHSGNFESVACYPIDVIVGIEELTDSQRPFNFLGRKFTDFRVGIAETPIAEKGMTMQTANGCVDFHASSVENLFDFAELVIGFAVRV